MANNGSATAQASGGSGPYAYVWNTGQTGATINNLPSGVYTVTATDTNGCEGIATVQVGQTGSNLVVSATSTNTSCAGNDGTAAATSSGGTGVVTYQWNTGQSGSMITGLSSGTYTVTATDGNGCTGTASTTITSPPNIQMQTGSTDVSCFGDTDGSATAFIGGGTPPYTINWSNGDSGQTIENLAPGTYGVTASDANGCLTTGVAVVGEPQPLSVTLTSIGANGGNNGSASANVNGGTPGYSYEWNTGAATSTIENLAPAVYSVTVIDANGCMTSGNIVVEDTTPPGGNYCGSGGENTFYEWIESISVSDLQNTTGNDNGYGDYTSLTANLMQGASAGVQLTPGFSSSTYNEYWRIWIDLNQDGDFEDADELVFAPQPTSTAVNGIFNIPMSANIGITRMRISMKWSSAPGPCEFFTYGEVEDYTVNIAEGDGGGGCTNVIIDDHDFESGWGIWNDGGSDCRRSINDAQYANSGNYCVRLRDNTNSSVMTTDLLNLSSFEDITVDFTYITRSMDNPNEDFWLQISTDGGSLFNTVEEWNLGDEFQNGVREFDNVMIDGPFTTNTVLRFRCDASGNSDWVYIDDVTISGCTTNNPNLFVDGSEDLISGEWTQGIENEVNNTIPVDNIQLAVYPNPVKEELVVNYQMPTTDDAKISVFDLTGKLVYQKDLTNVDAGKQQTTIHVNAFNNGYYFLRIVGKTDSEVVKFLKL